MQSQGTLIDGYKKSEGRYPTFEQYLISFQCKSCHYRWHIDESDIKVSAIDELSYLEDLIADSVTDCPLCGSEDIVRLS